ncbi:MAG: biotin--[acetyl-CoA-carboxylase] ligase [Halothece sp.]
MNHQSLPIYHFQKIKSTNQTAWQLFQEGKKTPFVVTADEQTAGKGQWGRQWISSLGGLYLSLILTPEINVKQPSYLTISSVFGVTELLRAYQIPVQIKWLNDIFLNCKKLGGILIETHVKNQELKAVIIGIGLNWENFVPEVGITLKDYLNQSNLTPSLTQSSLQEELSNCKLPPTIVTLNDLKPIVINGLLLGYQRYCEEGITAILPKYEARLLT